MNKIPVTNDTSHNLHVGGSVLRPGETQLVEPHLVPPGMGEISDTVASSDETDHSAILAAVGTADILACLQDASAEKLDHIEKYEAEGKNRPAVMEGIAAERLRRAADTNGTGDNTAASAHVLDLQKSKSAIVIAELTALSLDDLHALEALEASATAPRKGVLEAIAAEHLRRASDEGDNKDGE